MTGRPETAAISIPGATVAPVSTYTAVTTARSAPLGIDARTDTEGPAVIVAETMTEAASDFLSTAAFT